MTAPPTPVQPWDHAYCPDHDTVHACPDEQAAAARAGLPNPGRTVLGRVLHRRWQAAQTRRAARMWSR